MKNKFKLLLILILINIVSVQYLTAQYHPYRIIDLSVKILTPSSGTYIKSPTDINIKYALYNNGPDTIFKEDSFRVNFFINVLNPHNDDKVIPNFRDLLPGDSIVLEYVRDVDYDEDTDNFHVGITAHLMNRSPNFNFQYETIDIPTSSNNNDYITYRHRWEYSHIIEQQNKNQEQFDIYPNPVINNEFFINSENKINSIEVYDIVGNTVFRDNNPSYKSSSTEYEIQLPKTINKGLFILKIVYNNESKMMLKRIVIQ